MQIAVVTDIHGNMEALEADLSEVKSLGVDEIICLTVGATIQEFLQERDLHQDLEAFGCAFL